MVPGRKPAGDDTPTAYLKNPSGVLYNWVQSLKAHDGRLIFSPEFGKLVVPDPGPDGRFNTSDDVERDFGYVTTSAMEYDVAGDFVAWISASPGPGQQITVTNLATGAQRQLTTHYSQKQWVALEPSGRVAWRDLLF